MCFNAEGGPTDPAVRRGKPHCRQGVAQADAGSP